MSQFSDNEEPVIEDNKRSREHDKADVSEQNHKSNTRVCGECSYTCRWPSELARHNLVHHSNTVEEPPRIETTDTNEIVDSENHTWRPIRGFEKYQVSNTGLVKNVKHGKVTRGNKHDNYWRINLYVEGSKRYEKRIHNLVADAFLKAPENAEALTIDHIDRDTSNNSVGNLRWASRSMQAINRVMPLNLRRNTQHSPPHDMKWMEVPSQTAKGQTGWYVSEDGCWLHYRGKPMQNYRFFAKPRQAVLHKTKGYMTFSIMKSNIYAHKIVAAAWIGEKQDTEFVIDHIDENKRNNNVNNLRYVSKSQNAMHSKVKRVCIEVENISTSEVMHFASVNEAARQLGLNTRNISASIRSGHKCRGYVIRAVDQTINTTMNHRV